MGVQAKFKVSSITRMQGYVPGKGTAEVRQIKLQPVTGGSPENDAFYAATPGGEITLQVVPAEVAESFELGGEMLVTFTPA